MSETPSPLNIPTKKPSTYTPRGAGVPKNLVAWMCSLKCTSNYAKKMQQQQQQQQLVNEKMLEGDTKKIICNNSRYPHINYTQIYIQKKKTKKRKSGKNKGDIKNISVMCVPSMQNKSIELDECRCIKEINNEQKSDINTQNNKKTNKDITNTYKKYNDFDKFNTKHVYEGTNNQKKDLKYIYKLKKESLQIHNYDEEIDDDIEMYQNRSTDTNVTTDEKKTNLIKSLCSSRQNDIDKKNSNDGYQQDKLAFNQQKPIRTSTVEKFKNFTNESSMVNTPFSKTDTEIVTKKGVVKCPAFDSNIIPTNYMFVPTCKNNCYDDSGKEDKIQGATYWNRNHSSNAETYLINENDDYKEPDSTRQYSYLSEGNREQQFNEGCNIMCTSDQTGKSNRNPNDELRKSTPIQKNVLQNTTIVNCLCTSPQQQQKPSPTRPDEDQYDEDEYLNDISSITFQKDNKKDTIVKCMCNSDQQQKNIVSVCLCEKDVPSHENEENNEMRRSTTMQKGCSYKETHDEINENDYYNQMRTSLVQEYLRSPQQNLYTSGFVEDQNIEDGYVNETIRSTMLQNDNINNTVANCVCKNYSPSNENEEFSSNSRSSKMSQRSQKSISQQNPCACRQNYDQDFDQTRKTSTILPKDNTKNIIIKCFCTNTQQQDATISGCLCGQDYYPSNENEDYDGIKQASPKNVVQQNPCACQQNYDEIRTSNVLPNDTDTITVKRMCADTMQQNQRLSVIESKQEYIDENDYNDEIIETTSIQRGNVNNTIEKCICSNIKKQKPAVAESKRKPVEYQQIEHKEVDNCCQDYNQCIDNYNLQYEENNIERNILFKKSKCADDTKNKQNISLYKNEELDWYEDNKENIAQEDYAASSNLNTFRGKNPLKDDPRTSQYKQPIKCIQCKQTINVNVMEKPPKRKSSNKNSKEPDSGYEDQNIQKNTKCPIFHNEKLKTDNNKSKSIKSPDYPECGRESIRFSVNNQNKLLKNKKISFCGELKPLVACSRCKEFIDKGRKPKRLFPNPRKSIDYPTNGKISQKKGDPTCKSISLNKENDTAIFEENLLKMSINATEKCGCIDTDESFDQNIRKLEDSVCQPTNQKQLQKDKPESKAACEYGKPPQKKIQPKFVCKDLTKQFGEKYKFKIDSDEYSHSNDTSDEIEKPSVKCQSNEKQPQKVKTATQTNEVPCVYGEAPPKKPEPKFVCKNISKKFGKKYIIKKDTDLYQHSDDSSEESEEDVNNDNCKRKKNNYRFSRKSISNLTQLQKDKTKNERSCVYGKPPETKIQPKFFCKDLSENFGEKYIIKEDTDLYDHSDESSDENNTRTSKSKSKNKETFQINGCDDNEPFESPSRYTLNKNGFCCKCIQEQMIFGSNNYKDKFRTENLKTKETRCGDNIRENRCGDGRGGDDVRQARCGDNVQESRSGGNVRKVRCGDNVQENKGGENVLETVCQPLGRCSTYGHVEKTCSRCNIENKTSELNFLCHDVCNPSNEELIITEGVLALAKCVCDENLIDYCGYEKPVEEPNSTPKYCNKYQQCDCSDYGKVKNKDTSRKSDKPIQCKGQRSRISVQVSNTDRNLNTKCSKINLQKTNSLGLICLDISNMLNDDFGLNKIEINKLMPSEICTCGNVHNKYVRKDSDVKKYQTNNTWNPFPDVQEKPVIEVCSCLETFRENIQSTEFVKLQNIVDDKSVATSLHERSTSSIVNIPNLNILKNNFDVVDNQMPLNFEISCKCKPNQNPADQSKNKAKGDTNNMCKPCSATQSHDRPSVNRSDMEMQTDRFRSSMSTKLKERSDSIIKNPSSGFGEYFRALRTRRHGEFGEFV